MSQMHGVFSWQHSAPIAPDHEYSLTLGLCQVSRLTDLNWVEVEASLLVVDRREA